MKKSKGIEEEPSKCFTYDTYIDQIKTLFGSNDLKLHCTECDSFVFSVKADDLVKHFYKLQEGKSNYCCSNLDKEPFEKF